MKEQKKECERMPTTGQKKMKEERKRLCKK